MPSTDKINQAKAIHSKQEKEPPAIINTLAQDFATYYANNAAFGISAFDFSVIFGEITGVQDDKTLVLQRAKVIMSPLHAKLFSRIMAANVKKFEETFGEIKVPEGATAREE